MARSRASCARSSASEVPFDTSAAKRKTWSAYSRQSRSGSSRPASAITTRGEASCCMIHIRHGWRKTNKVSRLSWSTRGRAEHRRVQKAQVADPINLRGPASIHSHLLCVDDESGRPGHLPVKVAGIELGTPHDLVDPTQLGDRELRRAKRSRQRSVFELRSSPIQAVPKDLRVIEREARASLQHLMDLQPFRSGRITAGDRRRKIRREGQVGDRHHPLPWVPVRVAIAAELLEMHPPGGQTGFLLELAPCGLLQVLVRPDKSSGQCPATFGRWLLSPHPEHTQRV